MLTDSVPYIDTLSKRDSDYFKYNVGTSGCDLSISVTAFVFISSIFCFIIGWRS